MTGKDTRPKDAHGWTLEGDRYIGPHKYIRPMKTNDNKDRSTEDKRDENEDAQKRDA